MATHDYVIANQSGAAFRTDLNNALAAIVSNNSNSSEPATKYAYQWWADTSNAVMKLRNSANDGWIELFQLDGTLTLENGSASAPALAFRDDLNTGLFSSANDHLNLVTAGVTRLGIGSTSLVINEGGADYDVRFEGDTNANLFYLDAGNNRIGIGTSSPASELSVEGKITANGDANKNTVEIFADTTTGQSFGLLVDAGTNTADYVANFRLANNNPSVFLRGDGNIGIGTTNCGTPVEIKHATATHNVVAINRANDDAPALMLGNDSSANGAIATNNADLLFGRDSSGTFTERMRMRNDGGLCFNGDSAAANAIDDYEEGGWSGLLNGGNFTATQTNFLYTKVGRKVTVNGTMTGFSSSSNGSNIELTGLPFSTESGIAFVGTAIFSKVNKYTGYGNAQGCRVEEASNRIVFMYPGQGANAQFAVRYTDLNNTSDSRIQFTATYFTAT